jgi:serine/threonine protein kinase
MSCALKDYYDLINKLGFGEFGEVWKGLSIPNTLGRTEQISVAIKIFKKTCKETLIANELDMNNELKEIQKKILHPNLVNVFDVNLRQGGDTLLGRKTLVMEFLGGGELYDRIVSAGSFSEKKAARTICSLASALNTIHSKNIIHRDIKPENIVYRSTDDNAAPVLVDFGFGVRGNPTPGNTPSNHINSVMFHDKGSKHALGTLGYIAPESYSHQVYMNKSDIWSLGVVTYIILVGFPPFDNKDRLLKERTVRGKYYPLNTTPWDHISSDAKDLVRHLLDGSPNDRYDAIQIMEHPWIVKHCGNVWNSGNGSVSNIERFSSSTSALVPMDNSTAMYANAKLMAGADGKSIASTKGMSTRRSSRCESKVADDATPEETKAAENAMEIANNDNDNDNDNVNVNDRDRVIASETELEDDEEKSAEFDTDYVKRIARLSSKRKMKKTVNGIVWSMRLRKAAMKTALEKEQSASLVAGNDNDNDNDQLMAMEVGGPPDGGDEALPPSQEEEYSNTSSSSSRVDSTVPASKKASLSLKFDNPNPNKRAKSNSVTSERSIDADLHVTIEQLTNLTIHLVKGGSRNNSSAHANSDGAKSSAAGAGSSAGVAPRMLSEEQKSVFSKTASYNEELTRNLSADVGGGQVRRIVSINEDKNVKYQSTMDISDSAYPDEKQPTLRRMSTATMRSFHTGGGVDYDGFCIAVKEVGLTVLANQTIFEIFDLDDNGTVSASEFISTLAQFSRGGKFSIDSNTKMDKDITHESQEVRETLEKEQRTRLYFSLFDQDGNGTISRTELATVVGMLMYDDDEDNTTSNTSTPHNITTSSGNNTPNANANETLDTYTREHKPSFNFRENTYNRNPAEVLAPDLIDEIDDDNNIPDTYNAVNDEIDYIELFDSIDTDGSGEISYDEFNVWFNKGVNKNMFKHLMDPIEQIEANLHHFFKN